MKSDDEALEWGDGADDPTYIDGTRRSDAPASAAVPALHSEQTTRAEARGADVYASLLLVIYGILAGAYALSVIGWVTGLSLDTYSSPVLAFEILYQFGQFLAIVSPVLWFGAVFVSTRDRPMARVVALAVGIVVVAPWPLIIASVT